MTFVPTMGWPQLRHNSPLGSLIKECLFSLSPPLLAPDLVQMHYWLVWNLSERKLHVIEVHSISVNVLADILSQHSPVQIEWMLCKRVDAGVHQFYGQLDMFASWFNQMWFNNPVEWLWLLWFGWHNLGFHIQCSYHHSQFFSIRSQKSLSSCVEIVGNPCEAESFRDRLRVWTPLRSTTQQSRVIRVTDMFISYHQLSLT